MAVNLLDFPSFLHLKIVSEVFLVGLDYPRFALSLHAQHLCETKRFRPMLEGTQLGIEGRIKFFLWLRGISTSCKLPLYSPGSFQKHQLSWPPAAFQPPRGGRSHLPTGSHGIDHGGGGSSQSRQWSMNWLEAPESVTAFLHQQQGWADAAEGEWPAKPKIFTIWPLHNSLPIPAREEMIKNKEMKMMFGNINICITKSVRQRQRSWLNKQQRAQILWAWLLWRAKSQ